MKIIIWFTRYGYFDVRQTITYATEYHDPIALLDLFKTKVQETRENYIRDLAILADFEAKHPHASIYDKTRPQYPVSTFLVNGIQFNINNFYMDEIVETGELTLPNIATLDHWFEIAKEQTPYRAETNS